MPGRDHSLRLGRDHGFRLGRIAARHPRLLAVSSAAAVAGISMTQRLLQQRSSERSIRERRRYRIAPGRETGPELRRVASGQLDIALEGLNGHPPEPEGIHDARKALKRGRALLRVSRHLLGREAFQRETRTLRDAGRTLSDARDAEVLAETAESLGSDGQDSLPAGALDRLRDAVEPQPDPEPEAGPAEARSMISEASSRVPAWTLPPPGEPARLGPGIQRIYRQGRKALRRLRKKPDDEHWHELRKRSKDLWHSAELLEASRPKRMRKLAKRAHRLSSLLGDDHDLAVLQERVRERPAQFEPGELELIGELIDRRRSGLQRKAWRLAKRLYKLKPGKFVRRLDLR